MRVHALVALLGVLALVAIALASEPLLPVMEWGVPGETLAAVHFIDVGQGDAILILTGDKSVLIDGGDVWAGRRILSYLEGVAIERLDYVIVSNPSRDHIGGLPDILNALEVGIVYDPAIPHPTEAYQQLLATIADRGIDYEVATAGQVLHLAEGVIVEIMAPFEEFVQDTRAAEANNNSVVARLVAGEVAFLFTGDIEHTSEARLLRMGARLRADVLKVPNHGSRQSSSSLFMDQVRPRMAVISVGAYNEHGYPHLEVLRRLESVCDEVWRTDRHGTIVIVTDGRHLAAFPERRPDQGGH